MFKKTPIEIERFTPPAVSEEALMLAIEATKKLNTVFALASSPETRGKDFAGSSLRDAFTLYYLDLVDGLKDQAVVKALRQRYKVLILHALHFDWRVANSFLKDGLHGLESEEQVLEAKSKYDGRVRAEQQRVRQDEQQIVLASALRMAERTLSAPTKGSPRPVPSTPVAARTRGGRTKAKVQSPKDEAQLPPLPLASPGGEQKSEQ